MNLFSKLLRNTLWQVLSFLPKDQNKAVCTSYYGRGWSDSPKAIAQELLSRGWRVCWTVKGPAEAATLPAGVTPLRVDSPKAIWHQCTAGVWVDNSRKWGYTRKRGKTCYVQTWHGFPLKRIEGDAADALPPDYLLAARRDSAMADLFLSDSAFLSQIYRRAFWYDGDVLECGFPRNDLLTSPHPELTEKVRSALSLPADVHLALYAPTFRKDMSLSVYDMDYPRVVRALEERFGGKWLLLARLHPNIAAKADQLSLDPSFIRNASSYPDIQELYVAADALFTDYSSVMFDYLNTGRPTFLYVNDLAAYRDDRNFTLDLDRLPFPRAETNDALASLILSYDESAARAAAQSFITEFGIIRAGTAARQTADTLEQRRRSL